MTGLMELIETENYFTDKEFRHHYISGFYDTLFASMQDKAVSLLEIGTFAGESLKLWRDYFPKGRIWGVDIDPRATELGERIWVIHGNAYSSLVAMKLPNFHIVIDDGPHDLESQLCGLRLYGRKMLPGGIMVIEDIVGDDELNVLMDEALRMADRVTVGDMRSVARPDSLALIMRFA